MCKMNLSECRYLRGPYCRSDAAHIQLQTNEQDVKAPEGTSWRGPASVQK